MDISPSSKLYFLKPVYKFFRFSVYTSWFFDFLLSRLKTKINLFLRRNDKVRCLEVGADPFHPVKGFEALSVYDFINIDYVLDITKPMPFKDNTFKVIYASHVLEHVVWYQVPQVLKELYRICIDGGCLEIWVPDGLKIARSIVEYEDDGVDHSGQDGYYECMPDIDPIWWANLRLFAHGDGAADLSDPNWHRALFTERLLKKSLISAGFNEVVTLKPTDVRGKDHGWINLGVRGVK